MSLGLTACYEELKALDEELERAERDLLAAHLNCSRRCGPRPEGIFLRVLALRAESRRLLVRLGDEFVSAP